MTADDAIGPFVSDAEEQLDALNDNILILESTQENAQDPARTDAVSKLFRAFHTLKGNSATLGFEEFSHTAHLLEDLLDAIRSEKVKVDKDIIDLLLDGIDHLTEGLESIRNNKTDSCDSEHIRPAVEKLLHRDQATIVYEEFNPIFAVEGYHKDILEECKSVGATAYRIIVLLDETNPLRAAKALLLFKKLRVLGTIIIHRPADLHIGVSRFVDLIFCTKQPKDMLKQAIESISDFTLSTIIDIDAPVDPAILAQIHEQKKSAVVAKHKEQTLEEISSVKVSLASLDTLLNLVGELQITNMRFEMITGRYSDDDIKSTARNLDRLVRDIQTNVMDQRMIPVAQVLRKFPRMIRDLAKQEEKDVDLIIEDNAIKLDRTILDLIGDPLVHILRNAVDHGIEKPADRVAAAKSGKGTIKIIAQRSKTKAIITIEDDGSGIDPQKVKAAAVKRGVITQEQARGMTDQQAQLLVFRGNVSTNEVITSVSGRGVGMDVVHTNVSRAGGSVSLVSKVGSGTTIKLEIPLTLAIETVLMIDLEKHLFAIPLSSVNRIVRLKKDMIKTTAGVSTFILEGKAVQLSYYNHTLEPKEINRDDIIAVILDSGTTKAGLVVDQVMRQEQILIKPLQDRRLKGMKGVSGAAILGDGSVALVIDTNLMLESTG